MQHTSSSDVTFRIFGDTLIPEDITKLLGLEPTRSKTKGQVTTKKKLGATRTAKTGMWRLDATDCKPANLDYQIDEIFQNLPDELSLWTHLSSSYELDLFCGLFLTESSGVVFITPESMKILSSRGVKLKLNVYTNMTDD